MDRLGESERISLYGEYKEYTPFELCKIFLRSFFRDEDLNVTNVCQICARFEQFLDTNNIQGTTPNAVEAVKFFALLGTPITVQELKNQVKENYHHSGEYISFLDLCLIHWKKEFNDLFDRDIDGIPESLEALRQGKDAAIGIEEQIVKVRSKIHELENVKGVKIFEAKQEIDNINTKELEPLARKLDKAWADVDDLQDQVDDEGSQLDILLMELGLHDKHVGLFAIL